MNHHCLLCLLAVPALDSLAVEVRLLPEAITLALVPAAAAIAGALFAVFGALRRERPERLRWLLLMGNLLGAAAGLAVFLTVLLLDALA